MNKYLSGGGNCYEGKGNQVQENENAERKGWLICLGWLREVLSDQVISEQKFE